MGTKRSRMGPERLPRPLSPVLSAGLALVLAGCLPARWAVERLVPGPATEDWVLEMAPLDLPAQVSHHEAPQPPPLMVEIPANAWLRGFEIELVDGAGAAVDRAVLHHVKVIDPNRRDLFHPIMFRLVGAGGETRAVRLPAVLGYPLQRGDSLLVTAMVHNPTARDYTGLRIRGTTTRPGPRSSAPRWAPSAGSSDPTAPTGRRSTGSTRSFITMSRRRSRVAATATALPVRTGTARTPEAAQPVRRTATGTPRADRSGARTDRAP
jgi:hypothetical protein